jgi:hypothetical protein
MPHDRLSIGPCISIRDATGSGKTILGQIRLGLAIIEQEHAAHTVLEQVEVLSAA